jgi:hypothetical protein
MKNTIVKSQDENTDMRTFINNLNIMFNIHNKSDGANYEGLKIRMRSIIDIAKTITATIKSVFSEIPPLSGVKFLSTTYLKMHELIEQSKIVFNRDYVSTEKNILKIKKLSIRLRKHSRKTLNILFDLMADIDKNLIANYNLIESYHNKLQSNYYLRKEKVIYYGEEDGNFDDPNDSDYIFEEDQDDDEEISFDEADNDSEYAQSDHDEDEDEEINFHEDDNDSEYTPSEDEEDEEDEINLDEDDNDSEYTPSEGEEDEIHSDHDEGDNDEEINFDEDDNDSEYTPSEDEDDEDEDFEFDEDDDDDEDEDEDEDEEDDEEDKQFVSDYLNDPDYNPDEDEDEEDDLEYDYNFLNKKVDDNGNIVLKAGIANDNDEDDDDEDDEEDIKYNNKNMVNICKRRFENNKVVYRWVKMTKDEADKKYDEDYECEEN